MIYPVHFPGNSPQENVFAEENKVTGHGLDITKYKTEHFGGNGKLKHSEITFKSTMKEAVSLPVSVCGSRKPRKINHQNETLPLNICNMNGYPNKTIKLFHLPHIKTHPVNKNDVNNRIDSEWSRIFANSSGFKPIAFRSRPTFGELCFKSSDNDARMENEKTITSNDENVLGSFVNVCNDRQLSGMAGNDALLKPEVTCVSVTQNDVFPVLVKKEKLRKSSLKVSHMSREQITPRITGCTLYDPRSHRCSRVPSVPDDPSGVPLASRTDVLHLGPVSGACADCQLYEVEAHVRALNSDCERWNNLEFKTDSSSYHVRLPSTTISEPTL